MRPFDVLASLEGFDPPLGSRPGTTPESMRSVFDLEISAKNGQLWVGLDAMSSGIGLLHVAS